MLILPSSRLIPALLFIGALLSGACYGPLFTLFPTITADLFEVEELGFNYSLLLLLSSTGALTTPYLTGVIYDQLKTYDPAFYLFGSISLILLLIHSVDWVGKNLIFELN